MFWVSRWEFCEMIERLLKRKRRNPHTEAQEKNKWGKMYLNWNNAWWKTKTKFSPKNLVVSTKQKQVEFRIVILLQKISTILSFPHFPKSTLIKLLLRPLCFSNNFCIRNLSGRKESEIWACFTSAPANDDFVGNRDEEKRKKKRQQIYAGETTGETNYSDI